MKKMLITLLLAISTGSHATVLKNATDTFPLVSLQQKKVNDNITQDGKLPKASVIFWIDLDKSKSNSGKTIRNVKAKVSINKEGKIKVLEYNKKQPLLITNKIDKCLKTFRVKTGMDSKRKSESGRKYCFSALLGRILACRQIAQTSQKCAYLSAYPFVA